MNETTEPNQIAASAHRLAKGIQRPFLSLIIWAGLFSVATGSSVKTVNLPEMTDSAGMVFYGRCLAVETSSPNGILAKRYSFKVIEALKGVEPDQVVTFQQISGSGSFGIPGIPAYQKGQEVLLFLYPESRLGLTSPVGMGQGLFQPQELSDGRMGFSNAFGNRNLSVRLEGSTAAEAGLSEQQLNLLRSGKLISLDAMRRMVAQLDFRTQDESSK